MKDTSILPFPTDREKEEEREREREREGEREREREREHCGGINDKLQKITHLPFIISDVLVILCHYICFSIFPNSSPLKIFKGNLCLSHILAQTFSNN